MSISGEFLVERRSRGLRRAAANAAWRALCAAWDFVRQVSGDDAYERYLEHASREHPDRPPMPRNEYYRFRTEQKWSRITRCC
jgi:uncharacterized short protein YbdD (DUF466 family)